MVRSELKVRMLTMSPALTASSLHTPMGVPAASHGVTRFAALPRFMRRLRSVMAPSASRVTPWLAKC
jgi:hypothetical protein